MDKICTMICLKPAIARGFCWGHYRKLMRYGDPNGLGKEYDVSSVEYRAWSRAKERCSNPKRIGYENYGGRGIKMCSGMSGDFNIFLQKLGQKPSSDFSLDRINNNKHYSCGDCTECLAKGWELNCRWATPAQQRNNRRNSIHIAARGSIKTLSEWSTATGVNYQTLMTRYRAGWRGEHLLEPTNNTK